MLTMRDVVEADEYLKGKTYDYALPQGWVDDVYSKTGVYPRGFVWLYEDKSIWGRAYPVNEAARIHLEIYEHLIK